MDKQAIEHLMSVGSTAQVEPNDVSLFAAPEDMRLHDLERFADARNRERYTMSTHSVDAFIHYTQLRIAQVEQKIGHAVTTLTAVNPDTMSAQAIFNAEIAGERPGHCDDTAACVLRALPMWQQLIEIGEAGCRTFSQREIIEFIRDWHDYIPDAANLVGTFSKLTVKSVSEHGSEEQDFGRERTSSEKIDMMANGAKPPETIPCAFIPYEGFEGRTIALGVSALIERDEHVKIRVRVTGYEHLKLLLAQEFAQRLDEALDARPIIGTIHPS